MIDALTSALMSIRIHAADWTFIDLRIDIPSGSFGSDAINPHTQYSNPISVVNGHSTQGIGASFTLGRGNEMVCAAAQLLVQDLDGTSLDDLRSSPLGIYETLANPLQTRWLSPNAGVPLMAAGLIMNTLIDVASKRVGLPAWEYLAKLPTGSLLSLMNLRHLDGSYDTARLATRLDEGMRGIDERCMELSLSGLPVYFTTWLGHSAEEIAAQIGREYRERGIREFKVKIGADIDHDLAKLAVIRSLSPDDIVLRADANQTLGLELAKRWLLALDEIEVHWLEEPFAPDNVLLFAELIKFKREHGLRCEVVTGENCPNHYTALALMRAGIDRFQSDPCRMLGLVDTTLVGTMAALEGCVITPHAGGSALDELSPHVQLVHLARSAPGASISASRTENVGFCSRHFAAPTTVRDGRAATPSEPGFLVGVAPHVEPLMRDHREGISWLGL